MKTVNEIAGGDVHQKFHQLWTRSVNTQNYNRQDWEELEGMIQNLINFVIANQTPDECQICGNLKPVKEDWIKLIDKDVQIGWICRRCWRGS